MLNTTDVDGGAARAAVRLCDGLRACGVDVSLHVQIKSGNSEWVRAPRFANGVQLGRIRGAVDRLPLRWYRGRRKKVVWSFNWLPNPGIRRMYSYPADVVHLHWVGGGFLPIKAFARFKRPIVWTLHDMWPFTGGCHYDQGCGRFTAQCGCCPQLNTTKPGDISHVVWAAKSAAWSDLPMTIVAPSRWLAQEAGRSSLFAARRIEVIPNGIDLTGFNPVYKAHAKAQLGVPADRKLVLFGAMSATADPRKGYDHLRAALSILQEDQAWRSRLQLMIFGGGAGQDEATFRFPIHFAGQVQSDSRLSMLYSAADVMVVPSVQENLANTIVEALSCGTPVVAFDIGGNADMIEHMANGYLARPFVAADLAHGITWVLEDPERQQKLSIQARLLCEQRFSLADCARRYMDLYRSLSAGLPAAQRTAST